MKKKIKFFIILVAVFIAGGTTGAILMSIQFHRVLVSPFYSTALAEMAIDAMQLSQGKAEHVLKRKVMAIPPVTQSYYSHYYKFMPKDNSRYASLWQVQRYYEVSGDNIPANIKPILDSLPERQMTSCELRRIKDSNSPTPCAP